MRWEISIIVRQGLTSIFFELAKNHRSRVTINSIYPYCPRGTTKEHEFFDTRAYLEFANPGLFLYSQDVLDGLIHITLMCTRC